MKQGKICKPSAVQGYYCISGKSPSANIRRQMSVGKSHKALGKSRSAKVVSFQKFSKLFKSFQSFQSNKQTSLKRNKAKSANQLPSKVFIASAAKVRRQMLLGKSPSANVRRQKSLNKSHKALGKSRPAKVAQQKL